MEQITRYALYYAPPPGPLADRSAGWLGWDLLDSRPAEFPMGLSLPQPLAQLTAGARKYGFHGTLKPPFRLAPGSCAQALHDACNLLCADLAPVVTNGLHLHMIDGFLALVPHGPLDALNHLAAAVVRRLDPHRAPLTEADIARRHPDRLTDRQRMLLAEWGYPYVMEEFRFHLTLTDRLTKAQQDEILPFARAWFDPVLPVPFVIGDLCLCGEGADGRFRLLHRYPLSG
ncbi:MAG: hypothetical protein RIT14_665 [Pseudomonadota bacterium]|jgi:putative phosphonate metabolism protein